MILDLGGHILTSTLPANPNKNSSVGINSTAPNVTVRNGVVRRFNRGVDPYGGGIARVDKISAVKCVLIGIEVEQGDDESVTNCLASGTGYANGGYYGIWITGGDNVTISDNEVFDTRTANAIGISVLATGINKVLRNEVHNPASDPGSAGIFMSGGNANFVVGNRITNWQRGIFFDAQTAGKYEGNLTMNCTTPYIGGTAVGVND